MNHRMAIGTQRHQILINIKLIVRSHHRYRHFVMYLNKMESYIPIYILEIQSASSTIVPFPMQTQLSINWISFIGRNDIPVSYIFCTTF